MIYDHGFEEIFKNLEVKYNQSLDYEIMEYNIFSIEYTNTIGEKGKEYFMLTHPHLDISNNIHPNLKSAIEANNTFFVQSLELLDYDLLYEAIKSIQIP